MYKIHNKYRPRYASENSNAFLIFFLYHLEPSVAIFLCLIKILAGLHENRPK